MLRFDRSLRSSFQLAQRSLNMNKSVFAHEPDSTKRRGSAGDGLFSDTATGRHRGKALTPGQREQEERSRGHRAGGPGVEGENEIAEPNTERGIQRGYGKNQDKEQERKTPHNTAQVDQRNFP